MSDPCGPYYEICKVPRRVWPTIAVTSKVKDLGHKLTSSVRVICLFLIREQNAVPASLEADGGIPCRPKTAATLPVLWIISENDTVRLQINANQRAWTLQLFCQLRCALAVLWCHLYKCQCLVCLQLVVVSCWISKTSPNNHYWHHQVIATWRGKSYHSIAR